MQRVFVADGRPLRGLCCVDDVDGLVNLGGGGRKGVHDGANLCRMDAPHACVAKTPRGFAGGLLKRCAVLEFRHHAVRRHLGAGMASGSNFQLGAHHQRVFKLAHHTHAPLRDGTTVRRDKVHHAKRQGLNLRVRSNAMHIKQGAMRFDQRVQRNGALQTSAQPRLVQQVGCTFDIAQAPWFGQHEVGQAAASALHQHVQHRQKLRVAHWRQARAHSAKLVAGAHHQFADEQCVVQFAAHGCAIFQIKRDIKHRAHVALQLQAFAHELFDAAVVVTHRQVGRRVFGLEEGLAGVQGAGVGHGDVPQGRFVLGSSGRRVQGTGTGTGTTGCILAALIVLDSAFSTRRVFTCALLWHGVCWCGLMWADVRSASRRLRIGATAEDTA